MLFTVPSDCFAKVPGNRALVILTTLLRSLVELQLGTV